MGSSEEEIVAMVADNKIHVYGQGKGYNTRQRFTDESGKEFQGTINLAKEYFRALYPAKLIIISSYPKKRSK